MTTAVFRVPEMHCSACVMILAGLEDEITGIKHISASYHKHRLEVEYDEKQVTRNAIIAAANELGYELTPA